MNSPDIIINLPTPEEFNLWVDNQIVRRHLDMNEHKKEVIEETITRILADNNWLMYPSEDDVVDEVLSKLMVYGKELLTFNIYDKLLSEAILKIHTSILEVTLEKEIDKYKLAKIIDINPSSISVEIYF